jgi:predicted nucleic acid binding AN1-type Zn finger protein
MQSNPSANPDASTVNGTSSIFSVLSQRRQMSVLHPPAQNPAPAPQGKKRCTQCKKKMHMEFKCKCENMYCVTCRLPEVHACAVTVVEKVVLEKVVAEKVQRI